MTEAKQDSQSDSRARICTVKYRRPESRIESTEGVVFLLAIRDDASLKLYTNPFLVRHLSDLDQEYTDDLLKDLIHRAKTFPDEVFQQLSNLSAGPIITDTVEWVDLRRFVIEGVYPDFCLCVD